MGEKCCKPLPQSGDPEEDVTRFLMVGTGKAGKTTVIRQLKCLCIENPRKYKAMDSEWKQIPPEMIFSYSEKMLIRKFILSNIVTAVRNLTQQAIEWQRNVEAKDSQRRVEELRYRMEDEENLYNFDVPLSIAPDLIKLLQDPGVASTLAEHNRILGEYRIEDGTLYFLTEQHINRLFTPSVVLLPSDIVRARCPTQGISDYRFIIKETKIHIHDTGGQAGELPRIPDHMQRFFNGSIGDEYKNCLLFVTSMSDFNVPMKEHAERTELERSIGVLKILLQHEPIANCALMLFCNKEDRFSEIVRDLNKTAEGRKQLEQYLGDTIDTKYRGSIMTGNCKIEKFKESVLFKFHEAIKPLRNSNKKGVYMRYTQAIDPKMMAGLFDMIENEVLISILQSGAFML